MRERALDRAAAIVGLFVGLLTAGGLYLWQGTTEVAVAGFVIFGHISWLWMATRSEVLAARDRLDAVIDLPGNSRGRRTIRLLRDPNFWWSLIFGGALVTGSVRYAGMEQPVVLVMVTMGWIVIAVHLNFGLTIVHRTTKCRKCKYDLVAHLNGLGADDHVRCPECGRRWRKGDLCPEIPDDAPPAPAPAIRA